MLFLIPIAGFSQNKKEQIATLNFKLDSLKKKISNERQASKKEIEENEKKISSQEAQLIKLYDRVKKLNQNLIDSAGKMSKLNNEIQKIYKVLAESKLAQNDDLINKITYLRDSIISYTFRGGNDYSGDNYVDFSKLYDFSFLEYESDSYSEIDDVEFDRIARNNRVFSYFIGYSNDGKMVYLNLEPQCGELVADDGNCYDLFSVDLKTNNVDTIASFFEDNYTSFISSKLYEDFILDERNSTFMQVADWGNQIKNIIVSNCIKDEVFNYELGDFYKTNSFSIDNTLYKFSLSKASNKIILSLRNNNEEINIFSKKEEWDDLIYHGYYHLHKANMLCIVITIHKKELIEQYEDRYEYTHDVKLIGFDLSKKK